MTRGLNDGPMIPDLPTTNRTLQALAAPVGLTVLHSAGRFRVVRDADDRTLVNGFRADEVERYLVGYQHGHEAGCAAVDPEAAAAPELTELIHTEAARAAAPA